MFTDIKVYHQEDFYSDYKYLVGYTIANTSFVGNCILSPSHPNVFELYSLDEYDMEYYKDFIDTLPLGVFLFRYQTETTKVGNMKPLIRVDFNSYRVKFLENSEQDSSTPYFNRSSFKILKLNLLLFNFNNQEMEKYKQHVTQVNSQEEKKYANNF